MRAWADLCLPPLHQRLTVLLGAALLLLAACVPPPSPVERLTNAAYELNAATRFNRMDVAIAFVEPDMQLDFAQRHSRWGKDVRVLDVDLVGLRTVAEDTIEVSVAVVWHPIDELTIRQSEIAQRWKLSRDDWRMFEEKRVSGAPGVFHFARNRSADGAQHSRADGATGVQ